MPYFDIEQDLESESTANARCLSFIKQVGGGFLAGCAFGSGIPIGDRMAIEVTVCHSGRALDYELTSTGASVLSERLRDIISRVCSDQVEFVPIEVIGELGRRFVLNALHIVRCIDETKSSVRYCGEEQKLIDPKRRIESIWNMHLLLESIAHLHIFRPIDWPVALIVSDDLRQAILKAGDITGMRFVPVELS